MKLLDANRTIRILYWATIIAAICSSSVHGESVRFSTSGGVWEPAFKDYAFNAPCHSPISIRIDADRHTGGPTTSDIPIEIQVRKPGVALTSPPSVSSVYVAKIVGSPALTLNPGGSSEGCSQAWNVRLKPRPVSFREDIYGDIRFSFPSAVSSLLVEDAIFLGKGKSLTKNLGGAGGLSQGWVEVTGRWKHSLFGAPGPLPVKLNFELLKPDGSIAAYDTGYTSNEINPCCSGDKIKVRFLVKEHTTGQWKIRIRNDTGDDVMSIDPSATYTPACF